MKKGLFILVGVIALTISLLMYIVGENNPNLTELADSFWVPIPVGVIFLLIGFTR